MIKLIVFSVLLNGGDSNIYATVATENSMIIAMPPPVKIEARKRRGKGNKKRRRDGSGLR